MIRRSFVRPAIGLLVLTGCAGLISVPDLSFDENAPQGRGTATAPVDGGGSGGGTDSGTSSGGNDSGASSSGDSGGPIGPCKADFQTDPNHCGRCDHGCGGGACVAGKCEAIILLDGLTWPQQVAVGGGYVYVPSEFDGKIFRSKTDGTGDEEIAKGIDTPIGAAVSGQTLYWAGNDGVFRCDATSPTTCAASTVTISTTSYSRNIELKGERFVFTTQGDVRSMQPDGGGEFLVNDLNQPWYVATGGGYAYTTSRQVGLQRALLDGGGRDQVGPLDSEIVASHVAADDQGYVWAFRQDLSDAGYVYGNMVTGTAPPTTYTANGGYPLGVAMDVRYVYWTDHGTPGPLVDGPSSGNGRLLACPRGGCGPGDPITIAPGCKGGGSIVLDDAFIYFVENNNFAKGGARVRKVAKP